MHRFNWDNGREDLIRMSKVLDDADIYSVLLPYGATGPDYLVSVPDMIQNSKKLKFMVALRPYALSPEYAAKIFRTFNATYGHRLILNMVAGALSPEEEKFVFKHFNGDLSEIDNIDKRISFSIKWMQKLIEIFKSWGQINSWNALRPEMYTIANSPQTMEMGNLYFDKVICSQDRLEHNLKNKNDQTDLILIIDPLILEDGDESNIQYLYQPIDLEKGKGNTDEREQRHPIRGTYDQVKMQIIELSEKYGINDFMLHTDQKDISNMLRLAKELSDYRNLQIGHGMIPPQHTKLL